MTLVVVEKLSERPTSDIFAKAETLKIAFFDSIAAGLTHAFSSNPPKVRLAKTRFTMFELDQLKDRLDPRSLGYCEAARSSF